MTCADAVDNFLTIYDKYKADHDKWESDLNIAIANRENGYKKFRALIKKSSKYVYYNNNAYDCNINKTNDNIFNPCLDKKTGDRRCECQRKFDGRPHLAHTCNPYVLFRDIPKTYDTTNDDNNFRLWCKASHLDWDSVANAPVTDITGLAESDSQWPDNKYQFDQAIAEIKIKEPQIPSNINFSCQQCSTQLGIGDITNANPSQIQQYLNCVLQTQKNSQPSNNSQPSSNSKPPSNSSTSSTSSISSTSSNSDITTELIIGGVGLGLLLLGGFLML